MIKLKIDDKRVFDRAATLIANGSNCSHRVRQIIKKYLSEPAHKLAEHDLEMVHKFVRLADRPAGLTKISKERLGKIKKEYGKLAQTVAVSEAKGFKELGLGLLGKAEAIDPEQALEMLAVNESIGFINRAISKGRVARYSADMKSGLWELTGEPILIGPKGELLNGQHRLHAVIDSEKTTTFLIVRGISDKAFRSIDQGMPRRQHDVLHIAGVKNNRTVSGALRFLWVHDMYGLNNLLKIPHLSRGFTNAAALKMYQENPRIEESASVGNRCRHIMRPIIATFCHYICSRLSSVDADFFFSTLISGENLKVGDPIHTLRQRCINILTSRSATAHIVPKAEGLIWITFRAWNAYRKNEKLTKMSMNEAAVDKIQVI